MKLYTFLCLWSIVFIATIKSNSVQSDLILLDQIEVVLFGQEDVQIITKSDLDRPSLGGGYKTVDDLIFEQAIVLDAKDHKIPNDEDAVDAGIAHMQREHNLTSEDLEAIFNASGYTLEEGREQFQIMQMINSMLDVKVRSNLIVPRKDVEAYYNANPEVVEATYTIERIFIPLSTKVPQKKQKLIIEHRIKNGHEIPGALYSDAFTIHHSDIAKAKQFIYTMEIGDYSSPEIMSDGFEVFHLIDKTPEYIKTLDERYRSIVDTLLRPKYEELMNQYKEQLMKKISIVRF